MLLALLVHHVVPAAGQAPLTLTQEARFAKAPRGAALGTLLPGAEVRAGRSSGGQVEVAFEGWVPTSALGPFSRDGFDAVVKRNGTQLRQTPDGSVTARLSANVGFLKGEVRGSWTRVKRSAWIDQKALPAAPAPAPSGPDQVIFARKSPLAVSSGGSPAGSVDSGVTGRAVARSGGWTRVQLELWVPDSAVRGTDDRVLRGVSQAEVRANPSRYIGQVIEWRLQFVAIQKADELRPEMSLGQTYLLTRGPLPEPGFVYVVVPASAVVRFEGYPALKEFTVRGTIRSTTTKYLPTPVLELVEVVAAPAP